MALVRNETNHAITLDPGPSIAPGETANVDLGLELNADLLSEGKIRVTDPAVSPPAPSGKRASVRAILQAGAAGTELVIDVSGATPGQAIGVDGLPVTAGSGGASALAPTAVKTSGYTAAVSDLVPVDATSGGVTITLPTAPADKSLIAIKKIDSSPNAVTIARGGSDVFNKAAGSTSLTLSLANQAVLLQYASSTGVWYVTAGDVPLSQLDARFAAAGSGGSSLGSPNTQTVNYTLVAGDAGKVIEVNNASARTVTIPPNSSVPFAIGTVIEIARRGTGGVTLAPGAGVTLNSEGGALGIVHQYGRASLYKRATDEWDIVGDVLASAAFPGLRYSFTAGRYYGPLDVAFGNNTYSCLANYVVPAPIWIPAGQAFDRIGIEITTAGSASSVGRLGIYKPLASGELNGGSLELDAGTVAIDTTGVKTATISWTAGETGIYYPIFVPSAACSAKMALVPSFYGHVSTTNMNFLNSLRGTHASLTSGALPSTFPAMSWGDERGGPIVFLRAA